jgi:hypothetical protein
MIPGLFKVVRKAVTSAATAVDGKVMVAGVLVGTCVAGSVAVGAKLEEGSGPRTAVARILRMLAFVVVIASVLLLVARPGAAPQP